jgi:hypothetical protein
VAAHFREERMRLSRIHVSYGRPRKEPDPTAHRPARRHLERAKEVALDGKHQ